MEDRESAKLIADLKAIQQQADTLATEQEKLRAMLRETIEKNRQLIERFQPELRNPYLFPDGK